MPLINLIFEEIDRELDTELISNELIFEKITHFIIDVDGVMTNGQFIYDRTGKVGKTFGPHDHDGINLLGNRFNIRFITADHRGYPISHARIVEDMGQRLELVSQDERYQYLENIGYCNLIYMADGYFDGPCMKAAAYSIAPANAVYQAKTEADYITQANGGEGAVYEACLHILEKLK